MSNKTVWHGDNTSDTNLMAALAAMGVNADTACAESKGRIKRVWTLAPMSNDGKWKTSELLKWWRDDSFETTHFGHPFAVVKAALRIRKEIVDGIKKDKPLAFVKNGDQIALIHPDCSAETESKIMGGMQ